MKKENKLKRIFYEYGIEGGDYLERCPEFKEEIIKWCEEEVKRFAKYLDNKGLPILPEYEKFIKENEQK